MVCHIYHISGMLCHTTSGCEDHDGHEESHDGCDDDDDDDSAKVIMTNINMRALGGFVTLTHENTLNR